MDDDGNEYLNNSQDEPGEGTTVSGRPGFSPDHIGPWGPWDEDDRRWINPLEVFDTLNPNETRLDKIKWCGIYPGDVVRWEEEYAEYKPGFLGIGRQYILRKRQIEATVACWTEPMIGCRNGLVLTINMTHGQIGNERAGPFNLFGRRKFPNYDQAVHIFPGEQIMRTAEDLRSAKAMVVDFQGRNQMQEQANLGNNALVKLIGERTWRSPPRRSEYDGSLKIPNRKKKRVVRTKREKYFPSDLVGARAIEPQALQLGNVRRDRRLDAEQRIPNEPQKPAVQTQAQGQAQGQSQNQGQTASESFTPFHESNVIRLIDGKPVQGVRPLAEIVREKEKIHQRAQEIAAQNDYIEGQENMTPVELRRARSRRTYEREFAHLPRADRRRAHPVSAAQSQTRAAASQAQAPTTEQSAAQAQSPAPSEQSPPQGQAPDNQPGADSMSSFKSYLDESSDAKVNLDENVETNKDAGKDSTRKTKPGLGDDSPNL